MTTSSRHRLLAAVILALALPTVAAPSASAAYKECEFTKKKAKKHKAKRCAKNLHKSRWIVVSGTYRETLAIHDETDGATFDGKGVADFRALGLNGNSRFPSFKRPVRTMFSRRPDGIDFSASTTGGWTSKKRFYKCGMTIPESQKPPGFGGIFFLNGRKKVNVQWFVSNLGFACADGPYPTPGMENSSTVETYGLKRFRNKRIVRLPIAFDIKEAHGDFRARRTIDGIARLRRYR